jgi:serine/threonine-protein kinase
VLAALHEADPERAPTPVEQMMRAQCLARLGRPEAAVELALATLRRAPEEAEVAYQAALVFALAGEETSALVSVKRALELGVAPRWFSLPAFGKLGGDGKLARLLEAP